jgi:quinol monooxygenase YgiN
VVEWDPAAAWVPAAGAVDDPDTFSLLPNGSCIPRSNTCQRKAKGEALQAMVILRTIMNVLPEKQKEIMQTLLSMIDWPELGKGCLNYGISIDIEDGNIFYLMSEWETREHLDNFLRSERFSVLLGTKSLLSEPLKIDILTVSTSEGFEAVDLVRTKSNGFSRCTAERRLTS